MLMSFRNNLTMPPRHRVEKASRSWWLLGAAVLLASAIGAPSQVVINEIMYHPTSGNLQENYVELWNAGTGSTNLAGCRFTKGIQFVFPGNTVLGPRAYLVVAAN